MDYRDASLAGSRFERVDLTGAEFRSVDLIRSRFREVDLTGAVIRGGVLVDVDISAEIGRLVVNGVDVAPYVEAELDRRDPERVAMRPTTADGFRAAWRIVERRWAQTVATARALPEPLLHESVDDEWSFIQTLRHLVFATDAWVRRAILGDPSPWHPLGLPWDGMPDTPGVPRDRAARPPLTDVLALRADRMSGVRDYLSTLTDQDLDSRTVAVPGPGWPPPESFPVRECLLVVLNEEYLHRQFAERDLARLT